MQYSENGLQDNNIDKEISLLITRVLKDITGKGPQSRKIHQVDNLIILKIKGFLSNGEVLMAKTEQGSDKVKQYWMDLAKVASPIIKKDIKDITGKEPVNFYLDLNPGNNVGVIVLEMPEEI